MTPPGRRQEKPQAPHQRPADEQDETDRPLVPKSQTPADEPDRDPHAALNTPVGEPDPAATTDPYEDDPEAQGDAPPPGKFPGPGPEPE